jgi:DNA-binding NarL/FixJ family response regulator
MSSVLAAWPDQHAIDTHSLEQLVVLCLENLATVARQCGQPGRAARLLDAAGMLRQEPAGRYDELSEREWEVAVLIARGRSNRLIAETLVLSERTVDTHVSHILRKLSLSARAQIAAWVVQRRGSLAPCPET